MQDGASPEILVYVTSQEPNQEARAARSLLAFWRAAGVDMDESEAIFTAPSARVAPARPAPSAKRGSAPRTTRAPAQPLADARKIAMAAQDVAQLKAAVEDFDGCGLRATARNTVFCDGVFDAPVLLIGEAPGRDEDEQGKPFVGRSGQLLDRMLGEIGLSRSSNVLISNTIFWRPPGNRPPTQGEIALCAPFVERLIGLMAPKALVLCGGVAAQTILKRKEGVMRLRQKKHVFQRDGGPAVNAIVTLHPAYLLRRPQDKGLAWTDMLALETLLTESGASLGDRS